MYRAGKVHPCSISGVTAAAAAGECRWKAIVSCCRRRLGFSSKPFVRRTEVDPAAIPFFASGLFMACLLTTLSLRVVGLSMFEISVPQVVDCTTSTAQHSKVKFSNVIICIWSA